MSKKAKFILSAAAVLAPGVVLAAGIDTTIQTVQTITGFVGTTIPRLFFGLALAYFFYGLISYVGGVDDKTKGAARSTMIYGIIILFVMSSVWGLISVLQAATNTQNSNTTPFIPSVPAQ